MQPFSKQQHQLQRKPAYQVNLPEMMSLYERNYWRLKKLLGENFYDCADGDVFDFALPQALSDTNIDNYKTNNTNGQTNNHTGKHRTLRLQVAEITPYTCTLEFYELGDNRIDNEFLPTLSLSPRLSIRLYHDAQMAEVISFARKRHYEGRYQYPNEQMYQQDEKKQLNTLLAEWLQHCLDHGHTLNANLFAQLFSS